MAATRKRAQPRFSPILASLLIGSLIAGIAVTFLDAPASPNAPTGHGATPDSVTLVLDVAVAFTLLLVGGVVLYALLAPRAIKVAGVGPAVLSLFLVSIAFLVLVHFVVPTHSIGVPVNRTNSTSTGPPLPNDTPSNNSFGPLPVSGVPGWVAYLVLGVVVVTALLILAPALRARTEVPGGTAAETAAVRRSLETALRSLESQPPTDARQIIIGLYARLLATVGPYLENLATATPREIEQLVTGQFGIAREPAAELTRLFEEARYSTHPFTDVQVARARRALEAALLQVKIRSYTGGA